MATLFITTESPDLTGKVRQEVIDGKAPPNEGEWGIIKPANEMELQRSIDGMQSDLNSMPDVKVEIRQPHLIIVTGSRGKLETLMQTVKERGLGTASYNFALSFSKLS